MNRFARTLGLALVAATAAAGDWTQYAGDARRSSIAAVPPRTLAPLCWRAAPESDEDFVALASPVIAADRVFAAARAFDDGVPVAARLIAFRLRDGQRLWHADLPPDSFDSWASPAVDPVTATVVVCAANHVFGLDAETGAERWSVPSARPFVNASPAIAAAPLPRAFVVDYTPFGAGRLSAVNLAPFDPATNPHQPGDVVWYATVSRTSGNSPAVADGVVYCTSNLGRILAFDAASGAPLWNVQAAPDGFFGGITVRAGFLYAATYRFSGGANNSTLVKLATADGAIVWTCPCERTDSVPIVLADGRILLSAGIDGFGSAPRIQAYRDHGPSVERLWDTYADTGGALRLGGWTHQPVCGAGLLFAGAPSPLADFEPYAALCVLDLSRTPGDAGFVRESLDGAGGSPACSPGVVVSIGRDGLFAVGACKAARAPVPP